MTVLFAFSITASKNDLRRFNNQGNVLKSILNQSLFQIYSYDVQVVIQLLCFEFKHSHATLPNTRTSEHYARELNYIPLQNCLREIVLFIACFFDTANTKLIIYLKKAPTIIYGEMIFKYFKLFLLLTYVTWKSFKTYLFNCLSSFDLF